MEKASSNGGDFDGECTFRPKLLKETVRPRRSCAELSQGDALRRETNRRLLMLKTEREERKKHSFKPKLETSTTAESKLRIASQPDSYLDRLRVEDAKRQQYLQKKKDEYDEQTLVDYTFQPKTTKCPTYITRIAKGMALANKNKRENADDAKPDWR